MYLEWYLKEKKAYEKTLEETLAVDTAVQIYIQPIYFP